MSGLLAFCRNRWPALALVASLVLNGFLIGLMTVDSVRPHRDPDRPRAVSFELRRLAERLPQQAVDEIAQELEPLGPKLRTRFDRFRAIREEIRQLAAEPQPDRAAIDERLLALRAEATAMQEEVQRATYDALLKLPAETRAGLAGDADSG